MGRAPCCDKANVKKGPWSPEEDAKLKDFINKYGPAGNWIALPQKAGLKRCGKSCRLRWLNYLRPNIKHGEFSDHEDRIICTLYATIGSRWSVIASQLPGRTDNDIKNYWNTKLKKKILGLNHPKFQQPFSNLSHFDQPRKPLPPDSSINFVAPQNSTSILYSNTGQQHDELIHAYYPIKDNINMLVFGHNDTASCSSSDGSCSQISYGVVKNEEIGFLQGFIENHPNPLALQDPLGSIFDHHKQRNGVLENTQLQYDLEEVKQLITSGSGGGGGGGGLLFGDESKAEAMGMYYF